MGELEKYCQKLRAPDDVGFLPNADALRREVLREAS